MRGQAPGITPEFTTLDKIRSASTVAFTKDNNDDENKQRFEISKRLIIGTKVAIRDSYNPPTY